MGCCPKKKKNFKGLKKSTGPMGRKKTPVMTVKDMVSKIKK